MKYITYKGSMVDNFVMFPNYVKHDEMAQKLGLQNSDILGAGFVEFWNTGPECAGKSISLGISARIPEDERLIEEELEQ